LPAKAPDDASQTARPIKAPDLGQQVRREGRPRGDSRQPHQTRGAAARGDHGQRSRARSTASARSSAWAASSPSTIGRGASPRTASRKLATQEPSVSLAAGVSAKSGSSGKPVVLRKSRVRKSISTSPEG